MGVWPSGILAAAPQHELSHAWISTGVIAPPQLLHIPTSLHSSAVVLTVSHVSLGKMEHCHDKV